MGKKQTTEMTPYQSFRYEMEKPAMLEQFKAVLPAHITLDKFKRVCFTAFAGNTEEMQKCTQKSVLGACMNAATDGLLPDGREAAIVRFKDKAQYLPMVAGILKKIRNSGCRFLLTIRVFIVNAHAYPFSFCFIHGGIGFPY